MSEPTREPISDGRMRELRLIDAVSPCYLVVRECVAEIDRLRAELASRPGGEPVAWVCIRPERNYWTEDKYVADGWRGHGWNVVAYAAATLLHPAPPLPVFRNDVLTVYEANGRTATVTQSKSQWYWSAEPRGEPYNWTDTREQAEQAAARWVAGDDA